ncbi:MAG: NADH-quinone oxidoreductase subunit [Clostridia bacterium]|nr:NADH-quinone oxidoreductase subunit [Clostridia bacterium]
MDVLYNLSFWLLAIITVGSALMVVTLKNLSRAVIFLVIFFLGVGGFYFLMQAKFLALIQVVIYAGAVAVIFAFVIMLTPGLPGTKIRQSLNQGVALIITGLFLGSMSLLIYKQLAGAGKAAGIEKSLSLKDLGQVLFTDYLLPFELVSFVLLVALVGAVLLTARERGEGNGGLE